MHVEEDAGQSTTLKEKVTREQGWQRKKSYSDTERETMANANYYELLGVMRNAPPEVIRGAYKALAQKYHPDKHPGDAAAAKMMAALNEAARTLLDPARRQAYDEQLGAHAATAQEPSASEREESASPPSQATKNWYSGWQFWLVLIIAGISTRLIGALAPMVALGAFFLLQSRRGTVQAIAGAIVSGLVVVVIASTALKLANPPSPAAASSVATEQSSASNTKPAPERLHTGQSTRPFYGETDEELKHTQAERGPWEIYQYAEGVAASKRGDYASAAAIFLPLAEAGHSGAQASLGSMYGFGNGVQKDYVASARWYRLAANQGNAMAQTQLGMAYDAGEGVLQNYTEAVNLYRLAAAQGDSTAQSQLGVAYVMGRGVQQDNVRAHMWFSLAGVSDRSGNAVKNREVIAGSMTPQELDQARQMARDCQQRNFQGCE